MNDNDDGHVLVATYGYKDSDEWILDSGCTFHMTPNKTFFQTYETIDGENVTTGNNTTCKVVGVGSVKMKMSDGMVKTLTDVRYIPGLKKNLISLGTLDKIGCRITCEDGIMKVARGSLVVKKGKLNGSLYTLEGSTTLVSVNISINTMFNHDIKLWRLRLGHMGERDMFELSKQGLFDGKKFGNLFVNIVFMRNTRGLVLNPPYTTLREF